MQAFSFSVTFSHVIILYCERRTVASDTSFTAGRRFFHDDECRHLEKASPKFHRFALVRVIIEIIAFSTVLGHHPQYSASVRLPVIVTFVAF